MQETTRTRREATEKVADAEKEKQKDLEIPDRTKEAADNKKEEQKDPEKLEEQKKEVDTVENTPKEVEKEIEAVGDSKQGEKVDGPKSRGPHD